MEKTFDDNYSTLKKLKTVIPSFKYKDYDFGRSVFALCQSYNKINLLIGDRMVEVKQMNYGEVVNFLKTLNNYRQCKLKSLMLKNKHKRNYEALVLFFYLYYTGLNNVIMKKYKDTQDIEINGADVKLLLDDFIKCDQM